MSPEFVTGFILEALKVAILLAAPVLVFGLVAGLIVSIFQAATQINEMTLSFVPKLMVVALVTVAAGPWMLRQILGFTQRLIENIPYLIG